MTSEFFSDRWLQWRHAFNPRSEGDRAASALARGRAASCRTHQRFTAPRSGCSAVSFDHVLGDAGLSSGLKSELEQFAIGSRGAPRTDCPLHPPNQRPQVGIDWWPAPQGAGFPSRQYRRKPVRCQRTRVSGRMMALIAFQDRRKPPIQLDQEPTIAVREPDDLAPSAAARQADVGARRFPPQVGFSSVRFSLRDSNVYFWPLM